MMGAMIGSLAARTGRSLEEWLALVEASGIDPLDRNAVRRWLRTEHGVPQNSQWAIADAAARAAGWVRPSVEEYIDSQYRGAKAGLRPIYDVLASAIMGLGEDVRVEGRGGYTPFVRGRQPAAGSWPGQPAPGSGLGSVAGFGPDSRGQIPAGQLEGRIVAPERTTICCSAATCCSNAARPWAVSRAEVRGRLPMKPLRISA